MFDWHMRTSDMSLSWSLVLRHFGQCGKLHTNCISERYNCSDRCSFYADCLRPSSSFQLQTTLLNSNRRVGTLRLHREPIFYHIASQEFSSPFIIFIIHSRTVVNDVKIENHIADIIVHRIIRAHREGSQWKCCVLIPLLPGFTYPVDHSDASAVSKVFVPGVACLTSLTDSDNSRMSKQDDLSRSRFNICPSAQ